MGYTTEFKGAFTLTPSLTEAQVREINDFADERHGGASSHDGFPSFYCQWVASDDGCELAWDGGEKFSSYVEWLDVLHDRFFRRWDVAVEGEVRYRGEEFGDVGRVVARGGKFTRDAGSF